jgi:hypothetical protein
MFGKHNYLTCRQDKFNAAALFRSIWSLVLKIFSRF